MKQKNWKRLSFLEQNQPIDLRLKIKRKYTFCHYCNSLGHSPSFCGTHGKEITLDGYLDAQQVELYSKDTEWKVGRQMQKDKQGWTIKVKLNHGRQEFKFLIDKKDWVVSQRYKQCNNTFGSQNNYVYVIPSREEDFIILQREKSLKDLNMLKVEFQLNWWSLEKMLKFLQMDIQNHSDIRVELWGEWDLWTQATSMNLTNTNENCKVWTCTIKLFQQKFLYKFKVNNNWVIDPYRQIVDDNNIENHIFNPNQTIMILSEEEDLNIKNTKKLKTQTEATKIKVEEMQTMDLWGHSINLVSDKIFIIGGVGRNSYTNLIYKVNPKNYEVTCIDMDDQNGPDMLAFHKTICYGQKIIVYGGQNEYQVSNKYHTFNCTTQKWTSFKFKHNMDKREHFSAVLKQGTCRVFFFGGYYFHPDSKEDKMFNDLLMLNLKLMNFVKLDTQNDPEARCHHTSVMKGWDMLIFGGCSISNYLRKVFDDIYKINLSLDSDYKWQRIEPKGKKPSARYGHLSLKEGQNMIIHGGKTTIDGIKETFLKDLWIFDMSKLNWTEIEITNMSFRRAFHDGCIYNNKIIIFGGKYSNKFCHRDPNSFYELQIYEDISSDIN